MGNLLSSPRVRRILTATVGTVAGNALGALLPFVIAAVFVSGDTTDAYFYALGAILYLTTTVAIAVEGATTPHVLRLRAHSTGLLRRFVSRTCIQGVVISTMVAALGIVVVRTLVLPHTSFSAGQQDEITEMLLLLAPLAPLISLNAVLAGTHYAYRSFLLPTSSIAFRSGLAALFAISFHEQFGIQGVAYGLVLGELVRTVWLSFSTRRHLAADVFLGDEAGNGKPVKAFWHAATPQIVSGSIGGVSQVVDKTVAATLAVGSVTVVELAQRIVYMPILLMTSGIGIVLGSSWSEMISSEETERARTDFSRVVKLSFLVATAFTLVMVPVVWLLKPLLANVINNPAQAGEVVKVFSVFAIGIPFAFVSQLGVRLLIATKQTASMPFVSAVTVVVNLVGDILLSRMFGVAGIALASALVTVINATVFVGLAYRSLSNRRALNG